MFICSTLIFINQVSFTLYPANSRVGSGNLEALRVEQQSSTPRFDSTPVQINGNINLSKYLISSSGGRLHNQSVLQSHFVPLRHEWPGIRYGLENSFRGMSWRRGKQCDYKRDWLRVRSPLDEMKYLLFFLFCYFFILVSKQNAALSQHAMPPEFGWKWGTECLSTSFPLPTLLF